MRKAACALLLVALAACGGQGGGDEASETATPAVSPAAADTTSNPCVGDTCPPAPMVRDTSAPCDTCRN
jgi:hypothetical protein